MQARRIDDTTFVVVDTETTGLRPEVDRIIEIAAVKVHSGRIVDRLEQLIDPGCPIPSAITRLTGITDADVAGQPSAEAVLPHFQAFLEGGVLVAHNLAFDRGFLAAELGRMGSELDVPHQLCTLRLARRVLRALPSKSLSSLKRHYRIRTPRAHRALDDAEATAIILQALVDSLRSERGLEHLDELLRWQFLPYRATLPEPAYLPRLRRRLQRSLPETPGVYFHLDASGQILYIGKARNLRNRVLSYFTAVDSASPRLRRLMQQVREVTWQETETELAALLEESRLIKQHKPRHNRAQLEYRLRPFLRLDTQVPFPTLTWSSEIRWDGASYFGPLSDRRHAEDLVRLLDELFQLRSCDAAGFQAGPCELAGSRCLAPCIGGQETAKAYAEEARRVASFLAGHDEEAIERIRARMLAEAADRRYEQAAWFREQLTMVTDTLERRGCIAPAVLESNGVALDSVFGVSEVEWLFVRHGRLVRTQRVDPMAGLPPQHQVEEIVRSVFGGEEDPVGRYREVESDEMSIVTAWLAQRREEIRYMEWTPSSDIGAFASDLIVSSKAAV